MKLKIAVLLLGTALLVVTVILLRQQTELEAARLKVERFDTNCRWTVVNLQTLRQHLASPRLQRGAAEELRARLEHEPNEFATCASSSSRPRLLDRCAADDFACYATLAAAIEREIAARGE